jgi:superfamily I DNA/RNA helicase
VKVRLVVHGVKKLARGLAPKEEILPEDLPQYLAPALLKAAAERDPAHLKIFFYDYYDRLVTAGFDLRDRPKVTIVTIHGSKGREAETVWLFSETYPKAFERGMDNEHRLAYVGVTRARSHLFIVHEQLYGTWTRPYPYPE